FPDFFEYVRPVGAFPLCRDRIRYAGAPVAAVVAEDRYLAEDAAQAVEVEFEELPAFGSIDAALADGAPTLYDGWPDNRMRDVPGNDPATREALASAFRVVSGRFTIQRHAAVPLETRGSVAGVSSGRLTLWMGAQRPRIART